MASRQEKSEQEEEQQQSRRERAAAMSPQEAQQYRATAQQNSIDAIRAAEERYAKAKQSGSAALYDTKDAVFQGLGATATYLAGKGSQAAGYTAGMGKQGFEAAKDASFTAGQTAIDLANQAAGKTKGASLSAGGYAAEKGKQGYEAAKDTTFTAGQKTAEIAKQAAVKTKDTGLSAAGYTAEKTKQDYEAARAETEEAGKKSGKAEENLGEKSEKTTEEKGETGGGDDASQRIVVKEVEPEIGIEGTGAEQSNSGAGGIFEAVGEAVIEAAVSAKETVFGKEQ
ncbi:hypothetical protein KSP39_PZI010983 [Platanthera zijinensis]|uniref:Seed biotin-containing protein SBP65 n=1 Tax=Platanthera zijinensis TaxID=2320716 RepID=A0AAP0G5E7_9ASPA